MLLLPPKWPKNLLLQALKKGISGREKTVPAVRATHMKQGI